MKLPTLEHFGACPECHEGSGYMNYRKTHWFYCERHKTAWCAGANLLSSWQYETEADWQANAERLKDYREVKPSGWGWAEIPLRWKELRWWFREWGGCFAWRLYGYRLFRWRMSHRKGVDDLPF